MNITEKFITWLAIAAITFAGLFAVYAHVKGLGRSEVQAQWDADKERQADAEKTAVALRVTENTQIATAQAKTNQLIKKGYSNEIAQNNAVHAAAISSLRAGTARQSAGFTGSTETARAGGADSTLAANWSLPAGGMQDLFALLQHADEVTAQCRALQKFTIDNGLGPEGENNGVD